jgi:sec-independent protein translocase protein TatC
MSAESEQNNEPEAPFLSHLVELRQRLLRVVFAVLVVFGILYPFSNTVYTVIADPLMAHLPEGSSMVAIDVASPFLIPLKLTLMLAVFAAIPYILHQVWAFVAPGLYLHERRLVRPLVVASTLLFYLGVVFAYFIVFPLVFGFFTSVGPAGVEVTTDIARYLDFIITLFFAFGFAFEVPVATILLVMTGVTTPDSLAQKRPYVFVGAFVVGMVLTPPDVISQTLLALPMWLLFEIGVALARVMRRRQLERPGVESGPAEGDGAESTANRRG